MGQRSSRTGSFATLSCFSDDAGQFNVGHDSRLAVGSMRNGWCIS